MIDASGLNISLRDVLEAGESSSPMTSFMHRSLSSHCSINQEDTVERKRLSNDADRWFPSGVSGFMFYFSSRVSDFRQHDKNRLKVAEMKLVLQTTWCALLYFKRNYGISELRTESLK